MYYMSFFLQAEGGGIYVAGALYLFIGILVCAFIFSNLIVAVVVTNLVIDFQTVKYYSQIS